MRSRLRSFLLTSALTFLPSLASAITISGLYVDGGAGYNDVQDQHVHANATPNGDAVPKFSVNHGTGFTGFGAVGWGFGNGLRVEAEGLYNFSHDSYDSPYDYTGHATYHETKPLWQNKNFVYQQEFSSPNLNNDAKYTLTVQKVQEAPQWLTSVSDIARTTDETYKLEEEFHFVQPGAHFENGITYNDSLYSPGDTYGLLGPVGPYTPFTAGTHEEMTSCADCYYVSLLNNLQQVKDLENGVQPTLSQSYLTKNWNAQIGNSEASTIANLIADGDLRQGIYYIGPVFTTIPANGLYNFVPSNPVICNDGKCSYTVSNYGNGKFQGVYVDTPPILATIHTQRMVQHNGTDESWGGFANVLYDFDLERLFGLKSIVTPFVGGGAGYLWQRYNRPNTMIAAITGTHGGFSWQGIAGVAFDTGISGLQITAQYRMIGQPGSFYNGSFNYGTDGGHANFDQRFNHQFIVGFRYAFHNQPVHIAPPSVSRAFATSTATAPAPVPARSYLVFFDWNQYTLTSRARQIVVEAAHATSYVHTTRINVNGYTDSSAAPGPAGQKYNYALSVKRARSVEAELIRNGVPASEIVIRGYGDTNPLVPTAPNTREPQNRRVEIILHA